MHFTNEVPSATMLPLRGPINDMTIQALEADAIRTAVITGASSGLGQATATALARQGWRVIVVVRKHTRGEAARDEIRAAAGVGARVDLVPCDLSSLAQVRRAARAITTLTDRVHVLVNNAGGLADGYHLTEDGFESTFAANHLGHFLLTQLLMPLLERAAPARIVNVSSVAHSFVKDMRWDDLQMQRGFIVLRAYGQAKLANILHVRELARRLPPQRVTANAAHPGAVHSRFGTHGSGWMRAIDRVTRHFMLSPERGADTIVWLATDPALAGRSGGYYAQRRLLQPTAAARSDENAQRLWKVSEQLAGSA
ncbi:MAG: family oxidoreductase [Nevskia sp.]|nr:family oxidoreductase [Nevskia sp.]